MARNTRKPKRKPDRLTRLLKPIPEKNIHPELSFKKSVLKVRLDAFQIAALKRLAKEHGTTLAREFDHAVDAYFLGLRREEAQILDVLVDQLREATANARKTVGAALRKTEKNLAHLARKKRSGRQR